MAQRELPGLNEDRIQHHGLAASRVSLGAVVGIVVIVVLLLGGSSWPVALTSGWDAGAATFLVWAVGSVWWKDPVETARHARSEDVSRPTADLILIVASVASLVAVGFTLGQAGHRVGTDKGMLILLAISAVTLAWATVHTVYMLRYSHLYYEPPKGGIEFDLKEPPDYRDFAYLALTIGMTFQVSDTALNQKRMRRTALRHALLSYVFGTVIVAVSINVVASLLNK
jgi:uncharacterized membrane protein